MKILNILALGLLLATATATQAQVEGQKVQTTHEVQMGETLYSLSRKYNVSVEELQKANPRMGDTLLSGSVVIIPVAQTPAQPVGTDPTAHMTDGPGMVKESIPCKTMYQVGKKETIFSISRQFHVTEEDLRRANPQIEGDKVKKGDYLCIPYTTMERYEMQKESEAYAASQREREAAEARAAQEAAEAARKAKQLEKIKVAVVLPFNLDSSKKSKEAVKMYDFYEGFLLAVDEMKRQGISVDVYAYEEPSLLSTGMDTLLASPMLPHMNLIVGPMRLENVSALANFSAKNNIPLAVPFSSKASLTASVPVCYQINANVSRLYKDILQKFIERYQSHNILIVSTGDRGEKADYLSSMKLALDEQSIAYKTVGTDDLAKLAELTVPDKKTVIVPVSNLQSTFEKIIGKLEQNKELDTASLEMFGSPEWQTYSEKNKTYMSKYHATFFCTFYTDPYSSQVQEFNRLFHNWFKRDPLSTYPQYGLLGYDTGKFFLTGLHEYGLNFAEQVSQLRIGALQNPMQFESLSNGNGFTNTYFRFVSY